MKVEVYNAKGELRRDKAGKPDLMHAADAINAAKTGKWKLKREKRQFGDVSKNVIVSVHEKNEEDYAKDIEKKRAAIEAQKKELEEAEIALQEKMEAPEEEEVVEEPEPVVEEGAPLLEED